MLSKVLRARASKERGPGRVRRLSHLLVLLIAPLSFVGILLASQGMWAAPRHASASYKVTGTAFDDLKQDGDMDAHDPGVNGVTVTAYNSASKAVATATSATADGKDGQYTLIIPDGTGPVRIEFSGFGPKATNPALKPYYPSKHNSKNEGTVVAFVDGTASSYTVNQGIEVPADYCQNNSNVLLPCYVVGNQRVDKPVMVSFPYESNGRNPNPAAAEAAKANQIGTTWGVSYRRSSDTLFASAFQKRHTGFGPNGGPGSIYLISGLSSG